MIRRFSDTWKRGSEIHNIFIRNSWPFYFIAPGHNCTFIYFAHTPENQYGLAEMALLNNNFTGNFQAVTIIKLGTL